MKISEKTVGRICFLFLFALAYALAFFIFFVLIIFGGAFNMGFDSTGPTNFPEKIILNIGSVGLFVLSFPGIAFEFIVSQNPNQTFDFTEPLYSAPVYGILSLFAWEKFQKFKAKNEKTDQ